MEALIDIENTLGITGLKPIQGDASTRQYFRCDQGIVMKDLGEGSELRRAKFVDISTRLIDANFRAPKVMKHVSSQGLMLMEDLGGVNLGQVSTQKNYALALENMLRFDEVNAANLVHYDQTIYSEELSRLGRFYLAPLGIRDEGLDEIALPYFEELSGDATRFVHVDYHSENLMLCDDGSLGIIDFQDARFGHALYDLASLVDDIRVDVSDARGAALKDAAFNHLNIKNADMWFHVLSTQRLLKIIGIFARLTREGRMGYDKLIPRCFELVTKRLEHPELKEWKLWFDDVVPKYDSDIATKLRSKS